MHISKRGKNLLFSKKAITRSQAVAIIIVIIIAIAAVYFAIRFIPDFLSNSGENSNGSSNGDGVKKLPDLKIDFVGPMTALQPGISNIAEIGITNIGEAKSGSYGLLFWIDEEYTDTRIKGTGWYNQDPLEPGEYKWFNIQITVDYSGPYTFGAEITPSGFQDGDYKNNEAQQTFNSSSAP